MKTEECDRLVAMLNCLVTGESLTDNGDSVKLPFEIADRSDSRPDDLLALKVLSQRYYVSSEDSMVKTSGRAYIATEFAKPPRRFDTGVVSVPMETLRATAQFPLAEWVVPRLYNQRTVAYGLVEEIYKQLDYKQNKMALSFLSAVAKAEGNIVDYNSQDLSVFDGLSGEMATVLPAESEHVGLHIKLQLRNDPTRVVDYWMSDDDQDTYDFVDKKYAFIFPADRSAGVWLTGGDKVRLYPWVDFKELTVGVSGFIMRGIAATDPGKIVGVDMRPNNREGKYPMKPE